MRLSVFSLFVPLAALLIAASPSPSLAQSALETPQPSPRAKVEQRVGVTDVAVEYSSPGVKGRTIWGGLVPSDKVWRTGANAPTKLTASRDFTLGGKVVPAGSYTVFTIPGSSSWTVILNSDLEAGADEHDPAKDVARLTVTPQTLSSPRERMTFLFSDTTDSGTNLDLEWEKVRVRIPLQVDTKAHVRAGIDKAVGEAWRPHFLAARYLLDTSGDLDQALTYVNTSVGIKPNWWNNWVKAQIHAKKGQNAEAVTAGGQAQQLGTGDNIYEQFFKEDIAKAVDGWKKK